MDTADSTKSKKGVDCTSTTHEDLSAPEGRTGTRTWYDNSVPCRQGGGNLRRGVKFKLNQDLWAWPLNQGISFSSLSSSLSEKFVYLTSKFQISYMWVDKLTRENKGKKRTCTYKPFTVRILE